MPAMYMRERGAQIGDTFKKFEQVAGRTGVYTGWDYVEIVENLLADWDIQHLGGLSPAAEKGGDPPSFTWMLPRRPAETMLPG